jgi:hypothetical protein
VLALNLAALVGGIAAPWIYNWISVSRNELAATQCGWGHLWKRLITLVFALYGILFAIYVTTVLLPSGDPALVVEGQRIAADPELAWGITMKLILPPLVLGLLIASFFAAAMSSADTYATTSSAMFVDFLYRRTIAPGKSLAHYLNWARVWAVLSIVLAALSTLWVGTIGDYIKLTFNLLCFLGIPIYFGVWWKRANRTGMWASFILGISAYVAVIVFTMLQTKSGFVASINPAFNLSVFLSTGLALVGMIVGSLLGKREDELKLQRFHVIINTPVGHEQRLVDAGIVLPQLIDAGLVPAGPEHINAAKVRELYALDSRDKVFGATSSIELRREPTLPWYFPGFIKITAACVLLVIGTWLVTKVLFVWTQ